MITHYLPAPPESFADLVAGRKTFELRPDDGGIQVGDRLVLQERVPVNGHRTGAWVTATVTHVLRGREAVRSGLALGYCVLSIRITERVALASTPPIPAGGTA